nr:MAG: hypothetical protein [Microviridae sp.]
MPTKISDWINLVASIVAAIAAAAVAVLSQFHV